MATPKKLPSGNWRVQVFSHKENGKPKYVSFTAPTKAEAARMALDFQESARRKPVEYSAKEAVEHYIELKKKVLSPSTISGYVKMIKNYEYFGYTPISKIMDSDLQLFINHLAIDKSPKTVRNIYGLLSTAMTFFLHKQYYVTFPQKVIKKSKLPTKQDISLLLRNSDRNMKVAISLASIGTLRRGEICALKYKDVDYTQNTVFVHSDMVDSVEGWVHKEIPKTESSIRVVRLRKNVIDLIGHGNDDDYIVPMNPNTLTKRFISIRDKCGLTFRFHDLRAFSASVRHVLGVPNQYIQKDGGWKTDNVLKSNYLYALSDEEQKYSEMVLDYFDDIV